MYWIYKVSTRIVFIFVFAVLTLIAAEATAQFGLEVENDTLTKTVLIHPVIETAEDELLFSREHTYKKHLHLGDQLARDFIVVTSNDGGIMQLYKKSGKTNKDWYGWRNHVMAPFDGKVTRINEADSTNKPGTMNPNVRPGLIFFKKENGATVIYAHVREIEVEKGDQVSAGEIVAKVGNNGNSRSPHVHVGAWKGDTPLQIQVDLYSKKRGSEKRRGSK